MARKKRLAARGSRLGLAGSQNSLPQQVAEESRDNVHLTTDEVIAYDVEDIEDVKVRVWESPGLRVDDDDGDDDEDVTGNDEKYLREQESQITEELDVVTLWLKIILTLAFSATPRTHSKTVLTHNFGKELWRNAVRTFFH